MGHFLLYVCLAITVTVVVYRTQIKDFFINFYNRLDENF